MTATGNNSPFEQLDDSENKIIEIVCIDSLEGDGVTSELGTAASSSIHANTPPALTVRPAYSAKATSTITMASTSRETEVPLRNRSDSAISIPVSKNHCIWGG